jgi:hypothetical protein
LHRQWKNRRQQRRRSLATSRKPPIQPRHVSENINGANTAVEATGRAASDLLGEADKLASQAGTLQTETGNFVATVRAA